MINRETGGASLRATFPNPGHYIQSGSSGKVRIPQRLDSVLLIPQQSTYELQGKRFVYLVEPKGSVKATQINVLGKQKVKYPQDYTIVMLGDSMTETLGNSDELKKFLSDYY